MIQSVLVDARNVFEVQQEIIDRISKADFVGLDLETEDSDAHDGIKMYRKNDTAKVFDLRRTKITGLSIYPDQTDKAYYFNLNHADVGNRVQWAIVEAILNHKKADAAWVAHNAPFEIANLRTCYGFELDQIICTLQMAVSTYGPDDYAETSFISGGLGDMANLANDIRKAFTGYQAKSEFTPAQGKVFGQICGKASTAAHSYNGHVNSISYGYGLKKAVKSFFGHQMKTFEETLGKKAHMGELTGEEVVSYGCDDAYWAIRLMHHLFGMMSKQGDKLVETFFEQENPMIRVYADIWCNGMAVNAKAIEERRDTERTNYATVLRELRAAMKRFSFKPELNPDLAKRDEWYAKNGKSYRAKLEAWMNLPFEPSAYAEVLRVSGSVSKPWFKENGGNENKLLGPNFSHYMPIRTIIYDLLGLKVITDRGKTQSDGEARGKLIERLKGTVEKHDTLDDMLDESSDDLSVDLQKNDTATGLSEETKTAITVIEKLNQIASIEQAMKLYLNSYMLLKDPETDRVYPVVSSMLATRRMAARFPNPMQLAKQGNTVYIRDFFRGDDKDHLVVSLDWSQIELVLIGELSGDPEFKKAYGQLPYDDLHKVAAADLLSVLYNTTVTPEMFASLKSMDDSVVEPFGFPLLDAQGNVLTPSAAYKYNRGTAGGKGCNFGYWYSGALASVAAARGVSHDDMWKLTEAYRARFSVGEAWRVGTIDTVREQGFVVLPDGHRRNRFEATQEWQMLLEAMWDVFDSEAISQFARIMSQRISRRAGNQAVNALIQGSCGTLAKRSILRINKRIKEMGLRARFLIPIHDELVFSVHYADVAAFIRMARQIMTDHPDLIKDLKLHCTAAVGRTFGPFHAETNPFGQIELDEAPKGLVCISKDLTNKVLPAEAVDEVIKYLHAA